MSTPKGVHLRYLGEGVRAVDGVGVFQRGTVCFVELSRAIELVKSGEFENVSDGPSAQAMIVRMGQDAPPSDEPPTRIAEPQEPAAFERELEEEERRLGETAAAAPEATKAPQGTGESEAVQPTPAPSVPSSAVAEESRATEPQPSSKRQ